MQVQSRNSEQDLNIVSAHSYKFTIRMSVKEKFLMFSSFQMKMTSRTAGGRDESCIILKYFEEKRIIKWYTP